MFSKTCPDPHVAQWLRVRPRVRPCHCSVVCVAPFAHAEVTSPELCDHRHALCAINPHIPLGLLAFRFTHRRACPAFSTSIRIEPQQVSPSPRSAARAIRREAGRRRRMMTVRRYPTPNPYLAVRGDATNDPEPPRSLLTVVDALLPPATLPIARPPTHPSSRTLSFACSSSFEYS